MPREDLAARRKELAMAEDPAETVRRFDAAFNRHDLSALAELVTEDCVFEDTAPPDGRRVVGREAVLEAWRQVMGDATDVHFAVEETITSGDRVIVLWRYSWSGGHVRGVDVMRVRAGKVSESFAYVKG
jgi:ketosteroid isomerase-like protein